jgi:hypothetical protein
MDEEFVELLKSVAGRFSEAMERELTKVVLEAKGRRIVIHVPPGWRGDPEKLKVVAA